MAHAEALIAFADAVGGDDDAALAAARTRVQHELGAEALVDTAAVASNFERMVRIADATGIPLDAPMEMMSADLREELDLQSFGSSSNTPIAGRASRAIGRLVRPTFRAVLSLVGALRGRARRVRIGEETR